MFAISLISIVIFATVATYASVGKPSRKETTTQRLLASGII